MYNDTIFNLMIFIICTSAQHLEVGVLKHFLSHNYIIITYNLRLCYAARGKNANNYM